MALFSGTGPIGGAPGMRVIPDPRGLSLLPHLNPSIPVDVRLGFRRPGAPVNPPGSLPGGPIGIPQPPSPQGVDAVDALARAAAGLGTPHSNFIEPVQGQGTHSNFEHMLNPRHHSLRGLAGRLPAQAGLYPQIRSLSQRLAGAASGVTHPPTAY